MKRHLGEDGSDVKTEDLCSSSLGKQRKQDCDQASDDLGITIGLEGDQRGFRIPVSNQPGVTGATLDAVGFRFAGFLDPVQAISQFDDVLVTLFPVVKQGKIFDQGLGDFLLGSRHASLPFWS